MFSAPAPISAFHATDPQGVGTYTADAADVLGDLYRQGFLGLAGNRATQGDLTVTGLDGNVQTIQIAVEQEAGLHLAGDPGITDRPTGIVHLLPGPVGGAALGADTELVLNPAYAFGIAGQTLRELAGRLAAGTAFESNHAIAAGNIDVQPLGVAIPQQLRLHSGGGSCIIEAAGEAALAVRSTLDLFTADLQLVVHLVDAFHAQGDLRGPITPDLGLHFAGQNGYPVLHFHVYAERTQMAVEGEGSPHRPLLASLGQLAAHVPVGGVGGHGAQGEHAEGGGGEGYRFQSTHRLTPFPVVIPSPKKWLFVRRRPQRVAERTLFRAV